MFSSDRFARDTDLFKILIKINDIKDNTGGNNGKFDVNPTITNTIMIAYHVLFRAIGRENEM